MKPTWSRPTDRPLWTAMEAAIRAPSPHNTQPWRFELSDDRIDVHLDPARVLAVADPAGREARLACGAAVFNIRTALAASGVTTATELLPDMGQETHLATVVVTGGHQPTPAEVALAKAIAVRRSNRRPFADRPVPGWIGHGLQRAARAEGAQLYVVHSEEIHDLAAELRRAEWVQAEDPNFQAELQQWTVTDVHHEQRQDGVPAAADSIRAPAESMLSLRRFTGDALGPERPYEDEPMVAVLTSHADSPLAQLRSGQAMQHVLLVATAAGLSASFLSQLVEVPASRAAVQRILGIRQHAQVVLRFGYGYAVPATRRRPVHDVTVPYQPEERS